MKKYESFPLQMKLLKLLFSLLLVNLALAFPYNEGVSPEERNITIQKCGSANALLIEDNTNGCAYKCINNNGIDQEITYYLEDKSDCVVTFPSWEAGKCIENNCISVSLIEHLKKEGLWEVNYDNLIEYLKKEGLQK